MRVTGCSPSRLNTARFDSCGEQARPKDADVRVRRFNVSGTTESPCQDVGRDRAAGVCECSGDVVGISTAPRGSGSWKKTQMPKAVAVELTFRLSGWTTAGCGAHQHDLGRRILVPAMIELGGLHSHTRPVC